MMFARFLTVSLFAGMASVAVYHKHIFMVAAFSMILGAYIVSEIDRALMGKLNELCKEQQKTIDSLLTRECNHKIRELLNIYRGKDKDENEEIKKEREAVADMLNKGMRI